MKNNLDFAIFLITAADISHVNEAEGVMPVCNLVLQNQAYAREKMSDEFEKLFSNANFTKSILNCIENAGEKDYQVKAIYEWKKSITTVKQKLNQRFQTLRYCNNPVEVFDPASEEEINDAYLLIKERIDSTFDPNKKSWQDIHKNNAKLVQFMNSHCRKERYHLEIFKCGQKNCSICQPI